MIPPAPEAWMLNLEAAMHDKAISCHNGSLVQVL